jgi:hypothetical protein
MVRRRNGMAAFINDARAALLFIEINADDANGIVARARRAFNVIPTDADATNDPAETAKAGKRTALPSNARIAMEARSDEYWPRKSGPQKAC